jgi:Domain of unknown function (DUF4157)
MLRAMCIAAVVSTISSGAFAWDPWGDVTHPERIITNTQRTINDTVNDIPNVPRNIQNTVTSAGKTVDQWRMELLANASAPALEGWFVASRDSAANGGVMSIPPQIRQALEGFYDDDILNRVRYKVGDNGAFNLASVSISYGDAGAVTLIDIVVFANQAGANNPVLWAHELKHVQQFRDWGVRDFAIRYLRSWNGVENEAYAAEGQFAQLFAGRSTTIPQQTQPSQFQQPMPNPMQQPVQPVQMQPLMGSFCMLPNGMKYGPGLANPVGSICTVGTPWGLMQGFISM